MGGGYSYPRPGPPGGRGDYGGRNTLLLREDRAGAGEKAFAELRALNIEQSKQKDGWTESREAQD